MERKHVFIKNRPENSSSQNSVTNKNPKLDKNSSSNSEIMLSTDLPCTILIEILGRLPIKTLINCRYVCKSWRTLLSESYFYRLFAQHMSSSLIIQIKGSSLNVLKGIYLIECEGTVRVDQKRSLMWKGTVIRSETGTGMGMIQDFRFQVGNSCNGLVCVRDVSSGEPVLVWNPMMGQFVVIPKPNNTGTCVMGKVVAGFGICGRTGRYKVVRIYHSNLDLLEKKQQHVEIYDFGVGDKWRGVGNAAFPIPTRIPGFYTHNSLHWILDRQPDDLSSNFELICSFDFMEEKFKVVAPPPIYSENKKNKYHWSNLGIVGGCLSMCAIDAKIFRADVQVWVMEDYCVPESWTMRFSVRDPTVNWWDPHRWIQVTNVGKDGEIVMLCAHSYLLVYSLRERRFTNMEELKFPAIALAPSFISLEDVLCDQTPPGSLNVRYL